MTAAVSVVLRYRTRRRSGSCMIFSLLSKPGVSKETATAKALEFLAQEQVVDRKKVESCLAEMTYEKSLQRDEQLR